ncbi:MAG: hypothetical protein JWO76_2916 [Nocardioides sp.]|nr:hypothetical protein [Nocardioides sp.]
MTAVRRRPRRVLATAVTAPLALALGLGLALSGSPADASRRQSQERGLVLEGVVVTKYVMRDASGRVIARGATATLGGSAELRPFPAREGRIRVATARRGHGVVVRNVRPAAPQEVVTAHR